MGVKSGRFIVIAGFFLLVFGLLSTGKVVWAQALTNPVSDTTLTAGDITFRWSEGNNVDAYWLGVGTSQKLVDGTLSHGDIYSNWSPDGTTSMDVTGIPINGKPIYVRLWWIIATNWSYVDYTYETQTTATGGSVIKGLSIQVSSLIDIILPEMVAPRSGVLSNLFVAPNGLFTPALGSILTLTIVINGVETNLSVTHNGSDGKNPVSNTSASVNVNQGDIITMRWQETGGVDPGGVYIPSYLFQ